MNGLGKCLDSRGHQAEAAPAATIRVEHTDRQHVQLTKLAEELMQRRNHMAGFHGNGSP